MTAIRDDRQGRLDRIDNELAAARGLREIALQTGSIEYDHLEAVIDQLIALRAEAERLPTVRQIVNAGGFVRAVMARRQLAAKAAQR